MSLNDATASQDPSGLRNDELLEHCSAGLDELAHARPCLDATALDGFLCGVLLQPRRVPMQAWWPWVVDADEGRRPAPAGGDALRALVAERASRLDRAIAARQWFDPWVFELEGDHEPSDIVAPWVAGFGLAVDVFPDLMALDASGLNEPLALLYRHLDPDDLEDADELLEHIEELEPPSDPAEAVEELVRATLLLADIARPQARPGESRRPARPGGTARRRQGPPRR